MWRLRIKRASIAIIAMVLLLGGCGQHVIIDWVDFVQLNDIHYLHDDSNELLLEEKDLGPQIGTVKFKVADNVHDPQYKRKDGDASFCLQGHQFMRLTDISQVSGLQYALQKK